MSFDRDWSVKAVLLWMVLVGCGADADATETGTLEGAVRGDEATEDPSISPTGSAGAPADDALDTSGVTTRQEGNWTLEQYVNERGETIECADLLAHNEQKAGDTTPFSVPAGESYHCFHFDSPWKEPVHAVATETVVGEAGMLHHWLLYDLRSDFNDGTHGPCLGTHPDSVLLTGWAPGNSSAAYDYVDDVGLEIPYGDNGRFLVEAHYLNVEDHARDDRSGVRICATRQLREHAAGIAWLGTEDIGGLIGIPPGEELTVSGYCHPSRAGLGPDDPIHVMGVYPHMHAMGRQMQVTVHRANGKDDVYLDEPFDVDYQIAYLDPIDILPGDTIETTCTYQNTSDRAVPWGPSASENEMCYAFLLHYPAGSLVNTQPSLAGAINTCLW